MSRSGEAGFTLIETLVALAVLALSSMAFLGATEAHVARVGALEYRAAALLAAQNYLEEATLGLDPETETVLLGVAFTVTAEREPTAQADLERLHIAVSDVAGGKVYAQLVGFVQATAPVEP